MDIQAYLDQQHVEYEVISHHPTYDAQRMAQAVAAPGREVAKTVLLRAIQGAGSPDYVVAVLPADKRIRLEKAAEALEVDEVALATEIEISRQFPDCEIGAVPPFGSLYGMQTLVDKSLAEDEQIYFEGMTHDKTMRMYFDDYTRLEKPTIAAFT